MQKHHEIVWQTQFHKPPIGAGCGNRNHVTCLRKLVMLYHWVYHWIMKHQFDPNETKPHHVGEPWVEHIT
jgi:hypothetical protein